MQRALILLSAVLPGCAITAGIGGTPEGTAWYEGEDPQFVLLAEPAGDYPVKPFFLHTCSIPDKDYTLGTNIVGISTRFEVGQ